MALVDALNGFWIAKMRGSRAVSIAIACLCLAVAASAASGLELARASSRRRAWCSSLPRIC
jgi:hypothetical protein